MAGANRPYPDDSLQSFVASWWVEADPALDRGRLAWAFVPHVDQEPRILVPEGRESPTEHRRVAGRVETLRLSAPRRQPTLPVAALPTPPGEVHLLQRAKRRPVLVLSVGGADVPRALRPGSARWQTAPTILVAPYYGGDAGGTRGGWPDAFVTRVRRCEYPQYLWDRLPVPGADASILRLDHLQPIGRHSNTYEATRFRLSDEALELVDQYLGWLLTGELDPTSDVGEIRATLLATPET